MTGEVEWMGLVPASRRLGVSVRELYAAVDERRIDARWVRDPWLRIEVAVDGRSVERLNAPAD